MLSVAERIAANAVFVCMLVEGVYLHRLIVAVFRKKLQIKVLYAVGAGELNITLWSKETRSSTYDDTLSLRMVSNIYSHMLSGVTERIAANAVSVAHSSGQKPLVIFQKILNKVNILDLGV